MIPYWERSQMQIILTEREEWAALCYKQYSLLLKVSETWPGFAADLRIKRNAFDKDDDCYSIFLA